MTPAQAAAQRLLGRNGSSLAFADGGASSVGSSLEAGLRVVAADQFKAQGDRTDLGQIGSGSSRPMRIHPQQRELAMPVIPMEGAEGMFRVANAKRRPGWTPTDAQVAGWHFVISLEDFGDLVQVRIDLVGERVEAAPLLAKLRRLVRLPKEIVW